MSSVRSTRRARAALTARAAKVRSSRHRLVAAYRPLGQLVATLGAGPLFDAIEILPEPSGPADLEQRAELEHVYAEAIDAMRALPDGGPVFILGGKHGLVLTRAMAREEERQARRISRGIGKGRWEVYNPKPLPRAPWATIRVRS